MLDVPRASQLLPVLAKYDRADALGQAGLFERLVAQVARIAHGLTEMRDYT